VKEIALQRMLEGSDVENLRSGILRAGVDGLVELVGVIHTAGADEHVVAESGTQQLDCVQGSAAIYGDFHY
jgi:hypothetical protein